MAAHLTDSWLNCYSKGWGRNRLRPASFAHPAKVSYGLSVRIYEHALEEGWVKTGDYLVDCFAGVGGFALEAMRHGLNFVGCELEQRFVDMAQGCDCTGISKADWVRFQGRWGRARYQDGRHWCPECIMKANVVVNERKFKPLPLPGTRWGAIAIAIAKVRQPTLFDAMPSASYVRNSGQIPCTRLHHYRGNIETWEAQGMPGTAVIVQGDSRRLGEVLERAQICVSSPPWGATRDVGTTDWMAREKAAGRLPSGTGGDATKHNNANMLKPKHPANLGNLPDTGFEAALALGSPPFIGSIHEGGHGIDAKKLAGNKAGPNSQALIMDGYGIADGQLARMPEGDLSLTISSPPFGIAETRNRTPFQGGDVGDMMSRAYTQDRQGTADGQLAALPEGSHAEACKRPAIAISSPPFLGSLNDGLRESDREKYAEFARAGRGIGTNYGSEEGQLGQMPPGNHAAALNSPCRFCGGTGIETMDSVDIDGNHSNYEIKCRHCAAALEAGASDAASFKIRYIVNRHEGARTACEAWLAGSLQGNPVAFLPDNIHVYGVWTRNWSRCFVQFTDKRIVIVKPIVMLEAGAETGKAQACISSPPFEASLTPGRTPGEKLVWGNARYGHKDRTTEAYTDYGKTPGNIGNETGSTFWAASRQILEEVYQVLAPGGHAIFVCKRFVRAGKIVEFSTQWARLCEAVGFTWIHHHKAWLVEDRGAQHTLDGGLRELIVRRMSFFRRLHAAKYPHLAIEWEDVLCFVKE